MAFFAHIGGFVFGLAVVGWLRSRARGRRVGDPGAAGAGRRWDNPAMDGG